MYERCWKRGGGEKVYGKGGGRGGRAEDKELLPHADSFFIKKNFTEVFSRKQNWDQYKTLKIGIKGIYIFYFLIFFFFY